MEIEALINPIVEKLILQRIKFEYGILIPKDIIANMTIEQVIDLEMKFLKTFFRTFILGREIRKETVREVIIYRSWWDHFKAIHFPKWLKEYFPVRSKHEPVEIQHYHLCPHTGVVLRRDQKELELIHINFLEGQEPHDWMKPFIKIAKNNQFGSEGKQSG